MNRSQSGQILSRLIRAGKRPRNQIATLSGLTNTYIRNLEKGQIENVPRRRLIALGVALNLDLSDIESLLAAFDRTRLGIDDVPVFIETARKATLSEAVLPVRDLFAYELILLAMEMAPGRQIIVADRPTISLMGEGHRRHADRDLLSCHNIYGALIEAIGTVRRENFFRLVGGHRVDHYICKNCLEDYLALDTDPIERLWRHRHVLSLLEVVRTQKAFHLHVTDTCVNLNFTLKLADADGGSDKLSYSARAPHDSNRGRLIGFITENPSLCACFKDEVARVADTAISSLSERGKQVDYLHGLLAPMADALQQGWGT